MVFTALVGGSVAIYWLLKSANQQIIQIQIQITKNASPLRRTKNITLNNNKAFQITQTQNTYKLKVHNIPNYTHPK